MQSEWEELAARVSRLEKQNRWLRIGWLTGLLALICVLTMGQAKVGTTVEAQRFILTSASGKVRAELTTLDGDYPRLSLRSPNGDKEVTISPVGVNFRERGLSDNLPLAHYNGLGLYLTDGHGHVVVEVGGSTTDRLQLTARPEITIFDNKGGPIWRAP